MLIRLAKSALKSQIGVLTQQNSCAILSFSGSRNHLVIKKILKAIFNYSVSSLQASYEVINKIGFFKPVLSHAICRVVGSSGVEATLETCVIVTGFFVY